MTTATYTDLVSDVDIRFQAKLKAYNDDNIKMMYAREEWTDGDPRKMTFQTYALPKWGTERTEHEAPTQSFTVMGNQLEKNFNAYSMAVDITDFMLKFDREKMADQIAQSLLEGCMREFNLQLTHQRLTFADTLNYQPAGKSYTRSIGTPDGLAPGSASHTVPGTGATTYSNILSSAGPLTIDNVTSLIGQLQKTTVDDDGELCFHMIDSIVVPNYFPVVKRAAEILGTPNVPFVMENTVNVFHGGKLPNGQSFKLIVLGMGAVGRDHKHTDGTQNDGTGVTATNRRFHWGVLDSSYIPAYKYAIAGAPEVFRAPPVKSGLYSIWGNMFACYVATRWQGTGFSFATALS